MSERVMPGPVGSNACAREAVCIHTKKVYDSCKSKECIRDVRVYLTRQSQQYIDAHPDASIKPREAELLFVQIDVEKVAFNRGFYSVDVRFFYRIECDAYGTLGRTGMLCGFAVADKRVILFGSEGGARIFSSRYISNDPDIQLAERANRPEAVVEVLDPIILDAKIVEPNYPCGCCCCVSEVPSCITRCFGEDIELMPGDNNMSNRLFVTLGQFSIIRLERDIQLLMPAYDVCLPEKDCSGAGTDTEDPCEAFDRFAFPFDEFFPAGGDRRPPSPDCRPNPCPPNPCPPNPNPCPPNPCPPNPCKPGQGTGGSNHCCCCDNNSSPSHNGCKHCC